MESPPVLVDDILGKGMECEKQTVQDIEIDTHAMRRCYRDRTAEHCNRLALGLTGR
jgi:hypothetical protein